jgi:hypothetical protein
MLRDWPDLAPERPPGGVVLTLGDAELLAMAVMSALLGFTSERRWLRYVNENLAGMFPRRIGQSGYNKRMRKVFFLFIRVIRMLAARNARSPGKKCGRVLPSCRSKTVIWWRSARNSTSLSRSLDGRSRSSANTLVTPG